MKGMIKMFNKTTIEDVSEMTGVSTATLRRWCDKGLVEHNKTYAGWRWFPEPNKTVKQIMTLLEGQQKQS
jgi:DNA-binding transcriptional MerR regulator